MNTPDRRSVLVVEKFLSRLRLRVVVAATAVLPLAANAELFTPWPAPPGIKVLKTEVIGGVEISEILMDSVEGGEEGLEKPCRVFAWLARPAADGQRKRPGILLCHGATNSALREKALGWAQRGYVAISPEFAGYVNRQNARSEAAFLQREPGEIFRVTPDPRASLLYDSIQTGLAAFELLRSQPDVDRNRLGISGVSWGGVMALMLAGILEDQVGAVASLYGTADFLRSRPGLGAELVHRIPDKAQREEWLEAFEPARRLANLSAPVLLQAATNDEFFAPSAVDSTLQKIPSPKFLCYGPNRSHWLAVPGGTISWDEPSWTGLEVVFFARALGGDRPIFPVVTGDAAGKSFSVTPLPPGAEGFIYIGSASENRVTREWKRLAASAGPDGVFVAEDFPKSGPLRWFGGVSFPVGEKDGGGDVTITTPIFSRGIVGG